MHRLTVCFKIKSVNAKPIFIFIHQKAGNNKKHLLLFPAFYSFNFLFTDKSRLTKANGILPFRGSKTINRSVLHGSVVCVVDLKPVGAANVSSDYLFHWQKSDKTVSWKLIWNGHRLTNYGSV